MQDGLACWCFLPPFLLFRMHQHFLLKVVSTDWFILIIAAFPSPLCERNVTRATQTGSSCNTFTIYQVSQLTARHGSATFRKPTVICAQFNLVILSPHAKENTILNRFLCVITTTWRSISKFPTWIIDFLYYTKGNCYFGFMLIKESVLPSPQDGTEKRNRVISKDSVCSALLRVALCEGAGEANEPDVEGDYNHC